MLRSRGGAWGRASDVRNGTPAVVAWVVIKKIIVIIIIFFPPFLHTPSCNVPCLTTRVLFVCFRPCAADNGHGHDAAVQSPVEQPPGAHDGRHRSAAAERDARGRDVGVRKDAVQSAQSRLVRLQVPTPSSATLPPRGARIWFSV